ncbi:MAG: metalloendopeptidase, partial [Alistipes sp.]|nr:metalloendopeptidase [Alistipes sp.]
MKKLCLLLLAVVSTLAAPAHTPQVDTMRLAALTPAEMVAADSLAALRRRIARTRIHSIFDTNDVAVVDTLPSGNDALLVVLYNNNKWKYVRN